MVSASDWNSGGPGLIPRRSKSDIFGIKTNRQTDFVEQCAGVAMVCDTHIGMSPT